MPMRKTIGLNGCFDYLHAGHLFMLGVAHGIDPAARIVVGINCDEYLRNNKREDYQSSAIRRAAILATGIVDSVEVFKEDTPESFIGSLKPDVYIIGEEYKYTAPEIPMLNSMGSRIVYVPRVGTWSTTCQRRAR